MIPIKEGQYRIARSSMWANNVLGEMYVVVQCDTKKGIIIEWFNKRVSLDKPIHSAQEYIVNQDQVISEYSFYKALSKIT